MNDVSFRRHDDAPNLTRAPMTPLEAVDPPPLRTPPPREAPPFRRHRLMSLDGFRGFIMLLLVSGMFGLGRHSAKELEREDQPAPEFWRAVNFHTNHPNWTGNPPTPAGYQTFEWSKFRFVEQGEGAERPTMWVVGWSFWDLIQPAFMFMAGMGLAYSVRRRIRDGDRFFSRLWQVLVRSATLILLGVFLRSQSSPMTNWTFEDVLTQIGLAYPLLFLLAGRPRWLQWAALTGVLVGYWYWMTSHPVPGGAAAWVDFFQKNQNAPTEFDRWFLNLFPRPSPFEANRGGYCTLNFIPSLGTMLIGLMVAEFVMEPRRALRQAAYIALGGVAIGLMGWAWGMTSCPIIKPIWTPSWALFSAGWVMLMLAFFHLIAEASPLRFLVWPLMVLGMNSIVLYVMHGTIDGWTAGQLDKHFGPNLYAGDWSRVVQASAVTGAYFLVCLWLYRQRLFVKL